MEVNDVKKIIINMATKINHQGLILNERYLHHTFSHQIQLQHKYFDIPKENILLHPEWPTYKKQTEIFCGKYRKNKSTKKYEINPKGTAGFIDFAIGVYNEPEIGIEFSLKYGWSHEEIVYDFIKLLDRKNPFKASISFNAIFRKNHLVKGKNKVNLQNRINEAFKEATKRLSDNICDNSRDIFFLITEIDREHRRRHWYFNDFKGNFKIDLPDFV